MTKLTAAQRLALDTFLSSYDETYTYSKILNLIKNEASEGFSICDDFSYLSTNKIAKYIDDLSFEIQRLLNKKEN